MQNRHIAIFALALAIMLLAAAVVVIGMPLFGDEPVRGSEARGPQTQTSDEWEPPTRVERPAAAGVRAGEPAVVVRVDALGGGVVQRQVGARTAAWGVAPDARFVVVFAGSGARQDMTGVAAPAVQLRGALAGPIGTRQRWRDAQTLLIEPVEPLLHGDIVTLHVAGGSGSGSGGVWLGRVAPVMPGVLLAVDRDRDGRTELLIGGVDRPLRAYTHAGARGALGRGAGADLPTVAGEVIFGDGPVLGAQIGRFLAGRTSREQVAVLTVAEEEPAGRAGSAVVKRSQAAEIVWLDDRESPARVLARLPLGVSVGEGCLPGFWAADIDADGQDELIIATPFGEVLVVRGHRGGGFDVASARLSFGAGLDGRGRAPADELPLVLSTVLADLDGDGRAELVLGTNRAVFVAALDRIGAVGAQPPGGGGAAERIEARLLWELPSGAVDLEAADLDGDGRVDLVVGLVADHDVLLENQGYVARADGRSAPWMRAVSSAPLGGPRMASEQAGSAEVAVVDLNADTHPDLIVSDGRTLRVRINVSDRMGGFGSPLTLGLGELRPRTFEGPALRTPDDAVDAVLHDGGGLDVLEARTARDGVARLLGADFDGDGANDLFGVTRAGDTFFVLSAGRALRAAPGVYGEPKVEELGELLPLGYHGLARSAAAGDVDHDGVDDLVVGYADGTAQVWSGDADGGPFTAGEVLHGVDGERLVLVDVDFDGDLDLVAADAAGPAGLSRGLVVRHNGGGNANMPPRSSADVLDRGKFGPPVALVSANEAQIIGRVTGLRVEDLDFDGLPDVVLGTTRGLHVFWGDMRYGYVPAALPAALADGVIDGLALADFDHNGLVDVAVAYRAREADSESVVAWLALGAGRQFQPPRAVGEQVSERAYGLSVADLDVDGRPDLIWATLDRLEIALSRVGRNGVFGWNRESSTQHAVRYSGLDGLTLPDLDDDGVPDPIVSGERAGAPGEAALEVWRSDGWGRVVGAREIAGAIKRLASERLRPLLVGDFTGDRRVEWLVIDQDGGLHLFTTTAE